MDLPGNGWMATGRVKASFILAVGLPAIWMPAGYLCWVWKGCHSTPFISDLALYLPESTLFKWGLLGTGLAMMVLMLDLYLIRRNAFQSRGFSPGWLRLNTFSLVPGAFASMGCIALAFTPWNVDFSAHVHQADAIFYGGVSWCAIATAGTWRLGKEVPRIWKALPWRLAGTMLAAVCLGGMIYNAAQFFLSPGFDTDALIAASQNMEVFCRSMSHPSLPVAAVFEWGLVFGLLFTIGSFWPELAEA